MLTLLTKCLETAVDQTVSKIKTSNSKTFVVFNDFPGNARSTAISELGPVPLYITVGAFSNTASTASDVDLTLAWIEIIIIIKIVI